MRTLWHSRKAAAFSLVELLVVIAIIALLAALLLPALTKGEARAQRIECISELKEAGTAFQMFAHEHQGRFPMQTPAAEGGAMEYVQAGESINGTFYFSYRQFQALANELVATKLLVCPTDLERAPAMNFGVLQNSNVSYFVGVTADYNAPSSILAGDRNVTNDASATASLVRGAYGLRWTRELHVFKGNVLFADAHVEEMNNSGMDLAGVVAANSVLFLPAVRGSAGMGLGSSSGGSGSTGWSPGGGGGQPAAPGARPVANNGPNAPQPPPPGMPGRNDMSGARMANHGFSGETFSDTQVRKTNPVAATNQPSPATATADDGEPEPPLLWLAGVARSAAGKGSFWLLLLLLLLLLALYVYARRKMRRRRTGRA